MLVLYDRELDLDVDVEEDVEEEAFGAAARDDVDFSCCRPWSWGAGLGFGLGLGFGFGFATALTPATPTASGTAGAASAGAETAGADTEIADRAWEREAACDSARPAVAVVAAAGRARAVGSASTGRASATATPPMTPRPATVLTAHVAPVRGRPSGSRRTAPWRRRRPGERWGVTRRSGLPGLGRNVNHRRGGGRGNHIWVTPDRLSGAGDGSWRARPSG
jgi:hypothetical protein